MLARIKTLTGNDPIRIEQKYGGISTIKFYGLLLLTSNFPFPIDPTDFSAQYRRVINLHMEKVITYADKKEDYSNVLSVEVINFLLLAIILETRMPDLIKVLNSFNLVKQLHVNNELKYKLRHSPDPIKLVNYIYDRMYRHNPAQSDEVKITTVHQAACMFVDYLIKAPALNIPVANVDNYNLEFNNAMDKTKPFG